MPKTPRNLEWLRSLKAYNLPPDFGARLYELISDMNRNDETLEMQTNSNLSGNPAPPPSLQEIVATPSETGVHVSIKHAGEFYRGIYYHVEYADNRNFTNPFSGYSGPSREIELPVGSRTIYLRAFASYGNSGNTGVVFHGGTTPQAVTGGTKSPLGTSQGSGTGEPGTGISGFGQNPYRGSKPPSRNP